LILNIKLFQKKKWWKVQVSVGKNEKRLGVKQLFVWGWQKILSQCCELASSDHCKMNKKTHKK
jgi:hypothetical protein